MTDIGKATQTQIRRWRYLWPLLCYLACAPSTEAAGKKHEPMGLYAERIVYATDLDDVLRGYCRDAGPSC